MSNKRQKQDIHALPRIIIPSGDFDLEIVMSIALLKFVITEFFEIIELSDSKLNFQSLLHAYKHTPNTYVVKLGGEYIPHQLTFDWSHNNNNKGKKGQKNKKNNNQYFNDSKRCKIVPLATVGLIYKLYGKQIIMKITGFTDSKRINWLYERTYFDFIEIIDANSRKFNLIFNPHDKNFNFENLKSNLKFNNENQKLPCLVKFYNLQLNDYETLNYDSNLLSTLKTEKLNKIINILYNSFINYVKYFAFSFLNAESTLFNAYNDSLSGITFAKYGKNLDIVISDITSSNDNDNIAKLFKRIIIIPDFIPWKEHLFTFEKSKNILGNSLYVIYPDSSKNWRLAAVPDQPSSFQSRKKLPDSWCGLCDDELVKVCYVQDASFVHSKGFIAGATSIEGCIKLAIKAVLA